MIFIIRFITYRILLRPFLRFIIGVEFPPASSFPEGQFILAANHNSHLDTASLLCALPPRRLMDVHPAAAADYFARNKLMALFCEIFINAVFVRRKGEGGKEVKPLDELDMHIKSGKSLILFPEGSRGRPEVMSDFKHGVSILLQRNPSIQLVPVLMKGMGKALPKGDPIPLPLMCTIKVGTPLKASDMQNKEVAQITEEIRAAIMNLAGEL